MTASFPSNELAVLLERSAWFCSAPAAMQAQLIEAGRVERLVAGQRLFTRGDSELFHVPRAALAALLGRTPAYWHVFGLLLTQKLRLAFDAIEETALLRCE